MEKSFEEAMAVLVEKVKGAENADAALKYTQAALNLAHAKNVFDSQ